MFVSLEFWNKLNSRIDVNTSSYTKIKLKIVDIHKDKIEYRLINKDEEPDYIHKVKKIDNTLYFNYFLKQCFKTEVILVDANYFTIDKDLFNLSA